MSKLTFSNKPTWLSNYQRLMEIANYHLYLPSDAPQFSSPQDNIAFNSGLRQFLFWKSQLLPSLHVSTVFLAFLGPKGLIPPNVLNITAALKNICDISQIVEFYSGANTNFLAISFQAKEPVTQIISHFRFFEDSVVLAITHNSTPLHRFRLLWLPPVFEVARVHHLLNTFSKAHRLRRESIPIAGGGFAPTNVVTGTITLEPGGDINKLPYLIQLPSPHKGCALLTIESRPPLCLKCRAIGHSRQKCDMTKCIKCNKVHFPHSPCGTSSYSSVASRNITSSSEGDWLANLTEDDVLPDSKSLFTSQPDLSQPPLKSSDTSSTDITSISTFNLPHTSKKSPVIAPDTECNRHNVVSPGSASLPSPHVASTTHQDLHLAITSDQTPSLTKQPHHMPSSPSTSQHDLTDDNSFLIATPSLVAVDTVAKFSRHKDTSKVIITEKPPPPSTIAKSRINTYSTASKLSTIAHPKSIPMAEHSTDASLFGDPDPRFAFSSDYESADEPPVSMDFHDTPGAEPVSRKRRGSSSFIDPATESDASSSSSANINSEPTFSSHKTRSNLHQQITTLYASDQEHIDHLESLCPDASFTLDIVKSLKLLQHHGFGLPQILLSPHILKFRFSELKRKTKYMEKNLGSFSISDICQHEAIEHKISSGSSVLPSGPFT